MSSFFKELFRGRNLVTALKGLLVGLIFGLVWFVYGLVGAALSLISPALALIFLLVFFIAGLFFWGYLANKIWGWK